MSNTGLISIKPSRKPKCREIIKQDFGGIMDVQTLVIGDKIVVKRFRTFTSIEFDTHDIVDNEPFRLSLYLKNLVEKTDGLKILHKLKTPISVTNTNYGKLEEYKVPKTLQKFWFHSTAVMDHEAVQPRLLSYKPICSTNNP